MRLWLLPLLCLALLPAARACGPYQVWFYEFGAFYYRDAGGVERGIDLDLVQELARRSGCTLQPQLAARVRIWRLLEAGELDITVSGVATPERLRRASFLPYLSTRNMALIANRDRASWPDAQAFLKDAARPLLGVVRSYQHGRRFDEIVGTLRGEQRVVEAPDFPTLLRLLLVGRVQAIPAQPLSLAPHQQQLARDDGFGLVDWAADSPVVASLVLGHGRVSAPDKALLQRHLAAMRADGTLQAIVARHVAPALLSKRLVELAR